MKKVKVSLIYLLSILLIVMSSQILLVSDNMVEAMLVQPYVLYYMKNPESATSEVGEFMLYSSEFIGNFDAKDNPSAEYPRTVYKVMTGATPMSTSGEAVDPNFTYYLDDPRTPPPPPEPAKRVFYNSSGQEVGVLEDRIQTLENNPGSILKYTVDGMKVWVIDGTLYFLTKPNLASFVSAVVKAEKKQDTYADLHRIMSADPTIAAHLSNVVKTPAGSPKDWMNANKSTTLPMRKADDPEDRTNQVSYNTADLPAGIVLHATILAGGPHFNTIKNAVGDKGFNPIQITFNDNQGNAYALPKFIEVFLPIPTGFDRSSIQSFAVSSSGVLTPLEGVTVGDQVRVYIKEGGLFVVTHDSTAYLNRDITPNTSSLR